MFKRSIGQKFSRPSLLYKKIKWVNILFVCSSILLINQKSLAADSSPYSSLDTNSKEFFKPSQIIKNCHKIVEEISSAYKLEMLPEKERNKAQKKINKAMYHSLQMLYERCPYFAFHHPAADAFCNTSYKGGEYICRIDTPPFQLFTETPPLTFCYQGIKRLLESYEFEPTLSVETQQGSFPLSSQKPVSPTYIKLKNLYSHTTANEVIYNIIYAYLNVLSTYLPTPQAKHDSKETKVFSMSLEEYRTKFMTRLHNLYNREEKNYRQFKEFLLNAGIPHDYNNNEVKNPRLFKLSHDKNLNSSLSKQLPLSSSETTRTCFSFGNTQDSNLFSSFSLPQEKENITETLFTPTVNFSQSSSSFFSFGKTQDASLFSSYLPSSPTSPLLPEGTLRVKEKLFKVLEIEGKGEDLTENYADIINLLSYYSTHAEKFGFLLQKLLSSPALTEEKEKDLSLLTSSNLELAPLIKIGLIKELTYNLDAKFSSLTAEALSLFCPSTRTQISLSPLSEVSPLPKTASTKEEALERLEALIKEEEQRKMNRTKTFPKRTSKKKGKATIKKENKQGVSTLTEENSTLVSVPTVKKTEEKTDLLLSQSVYYPERTGKEEQEWQIAGKKSTSSRKEDVLGKTDKLVLVPKTPEKKEKAGILEKAKRSLSPSSQETTSNPVLNLPKKDRKEPALASTPPRPLSSSTLSPQTPQPQSPSSTKISLKSSSPQTPQKLTPRNSKSPLSPQQQQTRKEGALSFSPATPPKILARPEQSSAELIPISQPSPTASFLPSLPIMGIIPPYFPPPLPIPSVPGGVMAVPTLIPPPDAVNIPTTEGVETYVRIKKAFYNHTTQEYDTSQEIRELVRQSSPFP